MKRRYLVIVERANLLTSYIMDDLNRALNRFFCYNQQLCCILAYVVSENSLWEDWIPVVMVHDFLIP